jgi:hypothetical protein
MCAFRQHVANLKNEPWAMDDMPLSAAQKLEIKKMDV